jgi:hypothetical protein
MILPLSLICLSVAFYSVKELCAHGKIRFSKKDTDFWGTKSYLRKYNDVLGWPEYNWYYDLFKITYKERWPTSATFTVAFTDAMHLFQSLHFITLSLGISLLANVNFFLVWGGVLLIHATVYRLLQR